MEFEITRLSSKGQVVIPAGMRKGFKEGEKLLLIRNENKIVLSKASELDNKLKEDLIVAKRVEAAWKEIGQGKGIRMSIDDFLKEMKSW